MIRSLLLLFFLFSSLILAASDGDEEEEKMLSRKQVNDTSYTVQDAIYNRPFITMGNTQTAVGGYLEANTNYFSEDGLSEGFSMEFRRFNIFLYSSIIPRVRFLSELEFEHGTEEINVETAILDIEINPAFVLRGGILLVPLGRFNQNHDSPQWEIIDRPFVSTMIIPSTLSEVGFGAKGRFFKDQMIFTYDAYMVNGLGADIVGNETGRTNIPSGKFEEMFEEDNNSHPSFTGRVGLRHRKYGEIGFSAYGGPYNNFKIEGEQVAPKRGLSIFAADFSFNIKKATIQGEYAYAWIDVPSDQSEQFGERQWGGFTEVIYPIYRKPVLGFDKSVVNATVRLEKVDFNDDNFSNESGLLGETNIFDDIRSIVGGLSFRPSPSTVLRANYRFQWTRDFLGNPTVKAANFQVGFATYF